LCDPI